MAAEPDRPSPRLSFTHAALQPMPFQLVILLDARDRLNIRMTTRSPDKNMTDDKPIAPTKAPPSRETDVSAFIARVGAMTPVQRQNGPRGRLVFAMDATMSRQPTWDRALAIQSEMFTEAERVGGLDMQLVYFRGYNECRASKWVSHPETLARLMTKVQCEGGQTQIGRVLSHVKIEVQAAKLNAAVYVGDAMEENIDVLCQLAGEIGLLGVPIFMFQEGGDSATEAGFRALARLTSGAYFRLDANASMSLRELLTAVAVYAAGGRSALEVRKENRGAALLLGQLKA